MGRLDVTTATNVSRTAQEPAFWAPLTGSCNGTSELATALIQYRGGCTDCDDEDAPQNASRSYKYSAREQKNNASLFQGSQRGTPQYRNWNAHKVKISHYIQDNRDKNINP